MNYRLEYDAKHGVLLLELENPVTQASIYAAYTAVENFAKGPAPIDGGIIDFSVVSEFRLPQDFFWKFIMSRPVVFFNKPRVVVAPGDVAFGMARMFTMYRESNGDTLITVVRTMDDAYRLLGLESPEFVPVGSGAAENSK